MFAVDFARNDDTSRIPSTNEYALMLEACLVLGKREHGAIEGSSWFECLID